MLFFVFRVYFDLVAGNWGTSGEWDGHSVEVGGVGEGEECFSKLFVLNLGNLAN